MRRYLRAVIEAAEKLGVPATSGPGGNNLMYAPATWRDVFAALDGDTLGLNLDPSHLVWQMIDYERAVCEFGPRIYHVHARHGDRS